MRLRQKQFCYAFITILFVTLVIVGIVVVIQFDYADKEMISMLGVSQTLPLTSIDQKTGDIILQGEALSGECP